MFKLIKLAAYGLAGYAAYQIYLGIKESGGFQQREFQRDTEREDEGRMGTLTGGGRGSTEKTEEPSGTSGSHKVGRGVI